jgi:hypothetical protein
LEEALLDELLMPGGTNSSGSSISSNVTNVVIDPTLTMDWTTLNPPDAKEGDTGSELDQSSVTEVTSGGNGTAVDNAAEPVVLYNDDDDTAAIEAAAASSLENEDDAEVEGSASAGDIDAAGTTKEAVSPPSNMDTEPERPHVNSTASSVEGINAEEQTEIEAANDNDMESELDSVISASTIESQGDDILRESTNATNTTTITGSTNNTSSAEAIDIPTGGATTTTTSAPTENVLEALSSPPTPHPSTLMITTSSPTPIPTEEEYEDSTDDNTPLPAPNEPPATTVDDDQTSENDDDNSIREEELPPTTTTGEAQDWDTTTKDEMYKEEQEEVKKVGGWLSFVSVVLLVYTAYQMSENPDGICAR